MCGMLFVTRQGAMYLLVYSFGGCKGSRDTEV